MRNLKDHSIEALRGLLARDGLEPYRAEQIAGWLYRSGVDEPERMTNLPAALRSRLRERWETRSLEVAAVDRSADGTVKAVLAARDGARIESVLIPEDHRTTLCV
jgi:23S rRNA (adenine2503-C2)-methyltransferase